MYLDKKGVRFSMKGKFYFIFSTVLFLLMIVLFSFLDKRIEFNISLIFYMISFVIVLILASSKYKLINRKRKLEPITYVVSVRPMKDSDSYQNRVEEVVKSVVSQPGKKEILLFTGNRVMNEFLKMLKEKYGVKVFTGYSRVEGMNKAIDVAKYNFLFYVDDNTILPKNATKLLEGFTSDDIVAVSGYRYYDKCYRNFSSWYAKITYSIFFGEKFKLQGLGWFVNVSGSNMLFRKSFLKENRFKVERENRTEDADISIRLYTKGKKVVIDKRVKSSDLPPKSLNGLIGQRIRWAEGWLQSYYQNICEIFKMKSNVKYYLLYRFLNVLLGIFIYPMSLSLLLFPSTFNPLGFFILTINWLSGIIQISWAEENLRNKLLASISYPLIFTIGYLFDLSAVIKLLIKDDEWVRTDK